MGIGLNIGLRGLITSQAALETIGHNVTNANTPGYSRQTLDVSATPGSLNGKLLLGTGVKADGVRRTVDELLNRRLLQQISSLGRLDGRGTSLNQIETVLGAGSAEGLSGLLQGFFSGISSLSNAPEDLVLRTGLVQSALQFTDQLREVGSNLQEERRGAEQQVRNHVEAINEIASRLSDMNRSIVGIESGGARANDLRDQRDELLRKLSDLMDVKVIENEVGAVRVLAAGGLLVHPAGYNEMAIVENEDGTFGVRLESSTVQLPNIGGRVGGVLQQLNDYIPALESDLDTLAQNLILEVNRRHSTGVPANGPMQIATSSNALLDRDLDGSVTDELLAYAGLPFAIQAGEISVNITNKATGDIETTKVAIDPLRTTVGDLLNALSAIPNLAASADVQGRVNIVAANGFAFDFSRRLDPNPNSLGTFGGGSASLGAATTAPYALQVGDTLQLQGPFGAASVTFAASDFKQVSAATAAEVAVAINADPSVQASGLVASSVGGQLFLQTQATGTTATLSVTGGTALGALGLTAGDAATGHAHSVGVEIGGDYTGADNDVYRFRPTGDGTVGTTPGLQVEVRNSQEQIVAILDVGVGYVPGEQLAVAEGVSVSFGFGELSSTNHDRFDLDVTADSDTTDVLAALGINSFFTGSGLLDIDVRAELQRDPSLVATSANGQPGDGGALMDLLGLQQEKLAGLSNTSLSDRLANIVSGVGLEFSSTMSASEAEQFLYDGLVARHDELTGVNVDEELVKLIEYEQAFQAASRFISVMSDIGSELLNLI